MMADKLPFRVQAAATRNEMAPEGEIPPFGTDSQGGAPGGRWMGGELPVDAGNGGFREGFSPGPANPPLPTDPMDGYGKPPKG